MNNDQLSIILMGALMFSILALFILVIIFISLSLKKKKDNKELEEKATNVNPTDKASKTLQVKTYTTNDVKSFLDFDEIKDNMIVQDKGKRYVMAIQCQGINYDLMSGMEKVAVEQGFVQFLNTLRRPIQLYVQSRKVNLEESLQNYNKRLKAIENKYRKLSLQYQQATKDTSIDKKEFDDIRFEYKRQKNLYEYTKDIISNTEKLSLNKNILTKNYYILISYMPDNTENLYNKEELIDAAFSELYTNAQSLLRILSVTGVTGKVLNSTELADLLYVAYNRDASEVYGVDKAIRAGYDSLYVAAPDVLDKKMEELDKLIKERALDLANKTIEEVTINSRKKQEVEAKERDIKQLVREMAKSMIYENEEYIPKEVVKESIETLDSEAKKEKKGDK
mgnify:CR=1 FL=1